MVLRKLYIRGICVEIKRHKHNGLFLNNLKLSILDVHDRIYLRYFTTCLRVNYGTELYISIMKKEPYNDYTPPPHWRVLYTEIVQYTLYFCPDGIVVPWNYLSLIISIGNTLLESVIP